MISLFCNVSITENWDYLSERIHYKCHQFKYIIDHLLLVSRSSERDLGSLMWLTVLPSQVPLSIVPGPFRPISRARIKTPPLAPLTNRQSDSEEQMADVEQFVAQLQAKRQMEAEQAAAAAAAAANTASDQPLIGPQIPGSAPAAE